MPSLERRIAALEAEADKGATHMRVHIVGVKEGETSTEAIARAGHDPDAPDTLFVCLVPATRTEPPRP
jgi:hypothetical protein